MSKLKNKNVQFGYLVFSIILIYLSIQFYSKDFNIYIAILGMVILLLTIFKPVFKAIANLWIKLGLLLVELYTNGCGIYLFCNIDPNWISFKNIWKRSIEIKKS